MDRDLPAPRTVAAILPRPLLLVAGIVLVVGIVLMITGAFRVGVTWDERIHAVMLEEYFTSGWYASPDWLVNGKPDAFLGKWPYYVYAPVAALVGHFFAGVGGAELWGGFSDTAGAYAARHLGAGFMALVGIGAAGAIVRMITGSWRWALLGAAVVASVPMWIGHGMFNGKDLPVGTGYTVATAGLVAMLLPGYGRRWKSRAGAVPAVVLGLALAVGTRPASGLPIVLTGMGMLACFGLYAAVRRRSPSWLPYLGRRSLDVVIAFVLGYLLLVAIYPKGFINPLTLAKESLLISGRFPVNDMVLTNGAWLSQPPPWFYLPAWFGFQLPLLVLVGCGVFLVFWVGLAVGSLRSRSGSRLSAVLIVVPVILQVALLPLLAIAAQSTMYNAVRQFLFVVPAAGVLAVLGIRELARLLAGRWRGVLWVIVGVGLVAPVIASVRLFPYTYTYFNVLASVQGVNGRWATDYWRASSQEMTTRIPPAGIVVCSLPDPGESLSDCGTEAPYEPFWERRGEAAVPGALGPDEFWFARENNGDVSVPVGCSIHDTVTRPLRGENVIIGQVFRCGPEAL